MMERSIDIVLQEINSISSVLDSLTKCGFTMHHPDRGLITCSADEDFTIENFPPNQRRTVLNLADKIWNNGGSFTINLYNQSYSYYVMFMKPTTIVVTPAGSERELELLEANIHPYDTFTNYAPYIQQFTPFLYCEDEHISVVKLATEDILPHLYAPPVVAESKESS